jgi:hypothetical protein
MNILKIRGRLYNEVHGFKVTHCQVYSLHKDGLYMNKKQNCIYSTHLLILTNLKILLDKSKII